MNHELHAAGFVEETLEDDRLLRRHRTERGARGGQILDELLRRGTSQPELLRQIGKRGSGVEPRYDIFAQSRHRLRKLIGSPRRFAQPERDARRLAVRVLDAEPPRLDPQNAIRRIAQLEDVPRQAFDREVLVDGADELARGLEHDVIVGGVGNRSARSDGREPCAATAAQDAVHRVTVQVRGAMTAARGESFGEHAHHGEILVSRQGRVGVRSREDVEQRVLAPFARRHLGDDLLGENIEWLPRNRDPVELAAADRIEQRRAFDQLVA